MTTRSWLKDMKAVDLIVWVISLSIVSTRADQPWNECHTWANWMNEWLNEWAIEWMNEWMNLFMNTCMYKYTNCKHTLSNESTKTEMSLDKSHTHRFNNDDPVRILAVFHYHVSASETATTTKGSRDCAKMVGLLDSDVLSTVRQLKIENRARDDCWSSRKQIKTHEVKNERFLISTRQNNVGIFGIRCL